VTAPFCRRCSLTLRRKELCKLKVKDFRHARRGVGHAAGGDDPGDEAAVNADLTDGPGFYRVRKGLPAGWRDLARLSAALRQFTPQFPREFCSGGAHRFDIGRLVAQRGLGVRVAQHTHDRLQPCA
jgi:hypothetical protein